ncbi:MAG: type 4a pilus biogenesis protein PilO [Bacillota bacterium]
MWRKLSPQMQAFLVVTGVAAFIYCFWIYILAPQIQDARDAREELRLAAARLEKSQHIAGSLKREKAALKEAEKEIEALSASFDTDLRDGLIFVDIGLEAARRNIAVTLLQPAAPVQKEHCLELPFQFTVQGDYRQVLEFIKKMENLTNVSEIHKLTVKSLVRARDPDASSLLADGRVQADFNITLYAAPTAENKMKLDALAKWAVGRENAYLVKGIRSPYPGD